LGTNLQNPQKEFIGATWASIRKEECGNNLYSLQHWLRRPLWRDTIVRDYHDAFAGRRDSTFQHYNDTKSLVSLIFPKSVRQDDRSTLVNTVVA